ncbi:MULTISPECIES: helicase-associated domain-containing protein [Paenibacillus]|uniref:XPB/Ssl2-like helicase family protein n=1 Tax=Paenibacillus pabuli TaxID=1472 RepID=A0A855Y374_9BACL|nr:MULTISPECIES: helicase-associated domain-containing protein [Paenibacillus]PWW44298.1 XPB/Ssl2-like helicase family protein [Paenibacillus pabuli]PXW10326.1 XPB/Ssl2-like helicase family protein [Paenibacillus taichungensis]RAJ03493.1 XPB/Ssl2-like helicase family protein [Paenibacillus pabuli]
MHTQGNLDVNSLKELSCVERTVLGVFFCKYAGQPFSNMLTSAEWAVDRLSRAEAVTAFIALRHKGWIKAVRKSWGERLYYIPESLLSLLTIAYAARVKQFVQQKVKVLQNDMTQAKFISNNEVQKVNIVREGKPDIAAELLHVLAWMVREGQAQGGLPLTSKGTIHKKMVQRLSRMTVLDPDDFAELGIRYDHADVYPVHVALVIDLLLSLGLIEKAHNRMHVSSDRLYHWLSMPWSSMHREIYSICLDRYGIAQPKLQHFRQQLLMFASRENEWLSIAAGTIERDNPEETIESIESGGSLRPSLLTHIRGWLNVLAGLGYGEVGESTAGELFYRWQIDPKLLLNLAKDEAEHEGKNTIFVQPDFEIMVPPDVTPSVRWNLDIGAELISRDRMSIYRITKERIVAASEIGLTADAMINFLSRYAGSGLPEHVGLAIQQWGQEAERLHIDAGKNVDEDEATDTVKKRDTWIYESRSELPEELNRTESEAIADESIVEANEFNVGLEVQKELFYIRGRVGLIQCDTNLHTYEQDHSITEQSGLFPGYGEIPEMWHNEWRGYHGSTARQIAAKAIEWQTKLGLKLDNNIVYVIPDQIHGHEDWTLTGWSIADGDTDPAERRTFSPNEWNQIRLIIPDHA